MYYELWLLLLIPFVAGILITFFILFKNILNVMTGTIILSCIVGLRIYYLILNHGNLFAGNSWLFVDSLSVYHILIMLLIYFLSTIYSIGYLKEELTHKDFGLKQIKIFASLWCESLAAMTLVLVSNNLAIMWVGMETTTLVTAFLISIHTTSVSLEAMWKYLLICSVGVAFAFMGTLLTAASAQGLNIPVHKILLWTELRNAAPHLNVHLMKFAFVFIIVGFGTKAGLAPMHNWLPDAHSQAPAPVSAVFSGFMLNAALYCIIRYIPIIETATSHSGWSLHLLLIFGILSIAVSSAFILMQHDLKRLLAYHSIEHLGIITLGLGLGGIAVFAALFHILNHSLCKTLAFLSAGRLGQFIGTHDMREMSGIRKISTVWSIGILGSLLALIGLAPFSIFISEFLIMKAAVEKGNYLVFILFVIGSSIVFVGALGHAIPLFWGQYEGDVKKQKSNIIEYGMVGFVLIVLLIFGLWMPNPLQSILSDSANIINGNIN